MPNRGQRTAARSGFDPDVRLAWLEGDADDCDRRHDTVTREVHELRVSVDKRLAKIMWGIFGLLVSIVTLSITIAASVLVP